MFRDAWLLWVGVVVVRVLNGGLVVWLRVSGCFSVCELLRGAAAVVLGGLRLVGWFGGEFALLA